MKRQTVSCVTVVPRPQSSAAKARTVRSGFSANLDFTQSATSPRMIISGGAPRGRAFKSPPARAFWPSRTAVAAQTPNRTATDRTVSPAITADAILLRRSSERDEGMRADLKLTTQQNHTSQRAATPSRF